MIFVDIVILLLLGIYALVIWSQRAKRPFTLSTRRRKKLVQRSKQIEDQLSILRVRRDDEDDPTDAEIALSLEQDDILKMLAMDGCYRGGWE